MVERFTGLATLDAYHEALMEQEMLVISPGGAARLLAMSRQRVLELVDREPRLRAWAYHDREGQRASGFHISVVDLLVWGVKRHGTDWRPGWWTPRIILEAWPRAKVILAEEGVAVEQGEEDNPAQGALVTP